MSGWGRIYNNTNYAIRLHTERLALLQERAATGLRILRTSDAPADAYRILHLRAQAQSLGTYTENVDVVGRNLAGAYSQLHDIFNMMVTAQTRAGYAASDGNAAQRPLTADEIDNLLEQMVVVANFQSLGRYLFSGADMTQAPYEVVREGGEIVAVRYQGSYEQLFVPVAPGVEQPSTLIADRVFRRDDRADPIFFGDTGATVGTGTASVRGDVWMSVTRTSTDYSAAAGLAEGTGAARDTILGDRILHVDGPAGTIQLDDGGVVTFDGTETDLVITNLAGDVVHVDTTGFAMGGTGDYTITGEGKLSIDDGASAVAIDFSDPNQSVTDSNTGRVLNVDSRNIVRTGVEPVRIPGTYDLFGTLINARDVMRNTRSLPQSEQTELLNEALESLKEVAKGLTDAMASVGARQQAMDMLHNSAGTGTLDNLKAADETQEALLQDADIIEVAIDLARTQTLYQMTLTAAAKLLSMSLLDFI